jgi:hypothetical protein
MEKGRSLNDFHRLTEPVGVVGGAVVMAFGFKEFILASCSRHGCAGEVWLKISVA